MDCVNANWAPLAIMPLGTPGVEYHLCGTYDRVAVSFGPGSFAVQTNKEKPFLNEAFKAIRGAYAE